MKALSTTLAPLLASSTLAQDALTNLFNSATQSALQAVGSTASTPAPSPATTSAANLKVLEFKSSPQVSAQMREMVIKALIDADQIEITDSGLTPKSQ